MTVYRIIHKKYADKLIASGIGNRWNLPGQFVIYTSSTKALACLENLVHSSGSTLGSMIYVCLEILIPDSAGIKKITLKDLESKERGDALEAFTRETGNKWYTENKDLLLQVPSSIITSENNYLINTLHTDIKKVSIFSAEPFIFDPRLK